MQLFKYAAITALSTILAIACAGGPVPAEENTGRGKPYLFTSHSRNITGMVEAIEHETRAVTLRGPAGNSITFTAGEEVLNLARIEAGDLVNAEYVYKLSIEVYDNPDLVPSEHKLAAIGRIEESKMPGLGMVAEYTATATVEAINFETGTFKLKWPDETVDEFTARDPKNLKGAEVGDLVVITQTARLAISVEEVAVE